MPVQDPPPGPLPLEDQKAWVSPMPAYPHNSAGAASCLQGRVPVAMVMAGGALQVADTRPSPTPGHPAAAAASPAAGLGEPSRP